MKQALNEREILAAELMVSRFYENRKGRSARVKDVLQYAGASGLHRGVVKEARKRLGVESAKMDGEQYWIWPDGSDPREVNARLSKEWWEHAGERD